MYVIFLNWVGFYHQNRAVILGIHSLLLFLVLFFPSKVRYFSMLALTKCLHSLTRPLKLLSEQDLDFIFQIDCEEDLLPCNGLTCSWNCNVEGSVGSEQKICKSTCEDDERIYTARCSCVEMFGPIQIAAPCKWKHWKAPVCEVTTTTTTSTTTTTTSTTTTTTSTTTTTEEQTEPPKPQPKKSGKPSGKVQFLRDFAASYFILGVE